MRKMTSETFIPVSKGPISAGEILTAKAFSKYKQL